MSGNAARNHLHVVREPPPERAELCSPPKREQKKVPRPAAAPVAIMQYPSWLQILRSTPPICMDGRWKNGVFAQYVARQEKITLEQALAVVQDLYSEQRKREIK